MRLKKIKTIMALENPYNPTPLMQQMPIAHQMRQEGRNLQRLLKNKHVLPHWVMQYGIAVYVMAMIVVSFVYAEFSLPWYYMLSGVTSVMVVFIYGSSLIEQTSLLKMRRERVFERQIFVISFILRLVWMILIYFLFQENYGDSFGFENGDTTFYDEQGVIFADAIRNGNFLSVWKNTSSAIDVSDLGYATYVGLIYTLTDNSIIVVRLIKCILSAITVLLLYRIARRNFDNQTARIAAIFCALWPNFWYYCGTHLKETEMVFLSVLFVEQADQMLRSRQFTAWKVVIVLLMAAVIYTFRAPLALVAVLALLFTIVMSSQRVVSWGKRIIVGGLAVLLVAVTMGNRISEEARGFMDKVQSGEQQENMEWRAKRQDGNAFAKYAGKSVFAPLIFTIPFPSFVRPFNGQDVQQLLNGGNFVKNIISSFTIFAMFMLLLSGNWRDHLLPLSFLLGYLVVLTMSVFAQSERFHQPAMPFEFMFAAYGMSIAVTKAKYKRWFTYWCGLMFVACIAWNWFKMAGRGLA